MQKISIVGFPRIGTDRELKKWTEAYFKSTLSEKELRKHADELKTAQWNMLKNSGVDFIPSGDFSFYDLILDTAWMLGVIPKSHRALGLNDLSTYFAMARGYQDETRDVKALSMRKWFNTNYHYIVPVIDASTRFELNGDKPFAEYELAKSTGVETRPVLIGPYTFLKLARLEGKAPGEVAGDLAGVYRQILSRLDRMGVEWVQFDEPALVMDLSPSDIALFMELYRNLLGAKGTVKVLLQTYFGDIRDIYEQSVNLDFDALGLDFVEGEQSLKLLERFGFPKGKLLFAGVINGRNIWCNCYKRTLPLLERIASTVDRDRIVIGTSCSLLHVPYTLQNEPDMPKKYKRQMAFAQEKLEELNDLRELFADHAWERNEKYIRNGELFLVRENDPDLKDEDLRRRIAGLKEEDFIRRPSLEERAEVQRRVFGLPARPTTTIGSFPQTEEIKRLRSRYKKGELKPEEYKKCIFKKIEEVIRLQEELGLDVLVHGEFERNDMVEYFGEHLQGFLFTKKAWVQSYGTRCVKPPILWGDVKRNGPISVEYIAYAQSLTQKPVKGMLTGPVTILNWSFPREDLPQEEIAYQIALAIKDEVEDLERAGIRMIQIDEAALREKLPLRKRDWQGKYLNWAIRAFRLAHSGVRPETQIHTHMCYSEFEDIIEAIEAMDEDVISFEAARSDLMILDTLKANRFMPAVGPGVYDIHSPRVPGREEIESILIKMIDRIGPKKLWVNPDCGLKTRGLEKTVASLKNMVDAAGNVRKKLY